ncbi:hypothetical protein NEOKW01_0817 [Nematocida sp. AWRm80]|nr:hypothetical protein NEOKW01_0817 [Nematocida sp. AWRm80]
MRIMLVVALGLSGIFGGLLQKENKTFSASEYVGFTSENTFYIYSLAEDRVLKEVPLYQDTTTRRNKSTTETDSPPKYHKSLPSKEDKETNNQGLITIPTINTSNTLSTIKSISPEHNKNITVIERDNLSNLSKLRNISNLNKTNESYKLSKLRNISNLSNLSKLSKLEKKDEGEEINSSILPSPALEQQYTLIKITNEPTENAQLTNALENTTTEMINRTNLTNESLKGLAYLTTLTSQSPHVHLQDGSNLFSKEHAIGVEYIPFNNLLIVLLYDETILRIHCPEQTIKALSRTIKPILPRTNMLSKEKEITTLKKKYNLSKVFSLHTIHKHIYLSETYISEVSDSQIRKVHCLLNTFSILLLLLLIILFSIPILLRISIQRERPIQLTTRTYNQFRIGTLFNMKRVLVLRLSNTPENTQLYKNILRIREITTKESIVYIEETETEYLLAYNQDILSLDDILKERPTEWITLMNRILIRINTIHKVGYYNIDLSPENIYIRKTDLRPILLGVKGMTSLNHYKEKEKDYVALGTLFYQLTKDRLPSALRDSPRPIEELSLEYRYIKYPRMHYTIENRVQLEVLDCISYLLTPVKEIEPETEEYQINNHPVFWSHKEIFEFIAHLSDYIFDHPQELVIESSNILKNAFIDQSNWDVYIETDLYSCLVRNGKYYYNTTAIRDLFRLIRNNGRHFQSIPENIRHKYFNNEIDNYTKYFLSRFPYLILLGYYVAKEKRLFEGKLFKQIFTRE